MQSIAYAGKACASTQNSISPFSTSADHPNERLLAVSTDSSLSNEARNLYTILSLMAWTKGRCWPSLDTQAEYLGRSIDSVCRYHRELEAAGLLIIDRSGHYNRYYPVILQDIPGRAPRNQAAPMRGVGRTHAAPTPKRIHKEKTFYVEQPQEIPREESASRPEPTTTETSNAFAFGPEEKETPPEPVTTNEPPNNLQIMEEPAAAEIPPAEIPEETTKPEPLPAAPKKAASAPSVPFDRELYREILKTTGDHKSRFFWAKTIKSVDGEIIRRAMSHLKIGLHEGSVRNPGAYLNDLVTKFKAESGNHQPPSAPRPSGPSANIAAPEPIPYVRPTLPEPDEPEAPLPFDPTEARKTWTFAFRHMSLQTTLQMISDAYGIDAAELWAEAGEKVDAFVDIVCGKIEAIAT
ncbi:MAG: helix-turn-helix domain-containing protein [Pseudomonadota bacterium]